MSKMVGFAGLNGVSTLLKRKQPIRTTIHFLAHRLALAALQVGYTGSVTSTAHLTN